MRLLLPSLASSQGFQLAEPKPGNVKQREAQMECLRCEGKMESGFVGDNAYGRNERRLVKLPVWFSGRPEWSFWGGLKLRGRKQIYVQTMRCMSCGYLESYAMDSPSPT